MLPRERKGAVSPQFPLSLVSQRDERVWWNERVRRSRKEKRNKGRECLCIDDERNIKFYSRLFLTTWKGRRSLIFTDVISLSKVTCNIILLIYLRSE